MIPYKDENPTRTFPFVTIAIITVNIIVFIWELASPAGSEYIVNKYGAIPRNLITLRNIHPQPLHPFLTVFSSMFLHGGLLHIGGNMLYLWIFGDNIEDRLGHLRFVFFYLACGIIAAYSYALAAPFSKVPMIGASGAIAGVLGAYMLLYPQASVRTLVFFGIFIQVIRIPALIVIGFWAIIQVVNGILSRGIMAQGGVAWFAHVGGFLAGLLTIKFWLPKRRYEDW